jgi:hypothetical protein
MPLQFSMEILNKDFAELNHYPYGECLYTPEDIEQEPYSLESYGVREYDKPNLDDFYQLEHRGEHLEDL